MAALRKESVELVGSKRAQSPRAQTAEPPRRPTSAATRYLIAAGVSAYGDWLTTVALVVLLYRLTGTATGPALYILFRVAPRIFGPAPGGALADRYGPARVAAACALGQCVFTASIVALAYGHAVWGIYVAVAASQFLGSMAVPAYNAIIPHIVGPARLGRINAIYNAILESCLLASPALGALLLIAGVTPQALVLGDAASFLVAALLLLSLRTSVGVAAAARRGWGMFAGIRVVRRDAMLRMFAIGHLCNAFVITALQAVLVVAAAQRFGRDTDVGWLYAAVGAGGVIGSAALVRWPPTRVRSPGIAFAVFGELIPVALLAIVHSLLLACALLFVSALFASLYQTRGAVGLQQRVSKELLGRVNAVIRFSLYFGMLLGAIVAAATLPWLSWDRLLIAISAVAAAVLIIALATQPPEPARMRTDAELAGKLLRSRVAIGSAARLATRHRDTTEV